MSARGGALGRVVRGLAAFALLALAACGKPVPEEHRDMVGLWESPEMHLLITADGHVDYKRKKSTGDVALNAPLQEMRRDGFTAGMGPLKTDFKINERPHEIDGDWWMTVDGMPLRRAREARYVGDER